MRFRAFLILVFSVSFLSPFHPEGFEPCSTYSVLLPAFIQLWQVHIYRDIGHSSTHRHTRKYIFAYLGVYFALCRYPGHSTFGYKNNHFRANTMETQRNVLIFLEFLSKVNDIKHDEVPGSKEEESARTTSKEKKKKEIGYEVTVCFRVTLVFRVRADSFLRETHHERDEETRELSKYNGRIVEGL